jgi:hypothetical protein
MEVENPTCHFRYRTKVPSVVSGKHVENAEGETPGFVLLHILLRLRVLYFCYCSVKSCVIRH